MPEGCTGVFFEKNIFLLAKGYYETLIGLNGAIKKQNESLNVTKRATSQIQGIAEKLKDDQEGINRLNAKELKQLQQKYGDGSIDLEKGEFIPSP